MLYYYLTYTLIEYYTFIHNMPGTHYLSYTSLDVSWCAVASVTSVAIGCCGVVVFSSASANTSQLPSRQL